MYMDPPSPEAIRRLLMLGVLMVHTKPSISWSHFEVHFCANPHQPFCATSSKSLPQSFKAVLHKKRLFCMATGSVARRLGALP